MTKTVRSRFNHEVGENVEGCKIREKTVVAPPNEVERRRGIYDYLVEVQPACSSCIGEFSSGLHPPKRPAIC